MRARRAFCVAGLTLAAGMLLGVQACLAQAAVETQLRIVSASYGRPSATHTQDFSERLQQICGDHAVVCQSFCSKSLAGSGSGLHIPFTGHPVCRVIYRCGDGSVEASETDDGEIIALSCKPRR